MLACDLFTGAAVYVTRWHGVRRVAHCDSERDDWKHAPAVGESEVAARQQGQQYSHGQPLVAFRMQSDRFLNKIYFDIEH